MGFLSKLLRKPIENPLKSNIFPFFQDFLFFEIFFQFRKTKHFFRKKNFLTPNSPRNPKIILRKPHDEPIHTKSDLRRFFPENWTEPCWLSIILWTDQPSSFQLINNWSVDQWKLISWSVETTRVDQLISVGWSVDQSKRRGLISWSVSVDQLIKKPDEGWSVVDQLIK